MSSGPTAIRRILVLWLLAGLLWMPTAMAATTCSATATSIAFGTVSTTGVTDVAATFEVTCSSSSLVGNTKVRMCLGIGAGANGGGNVNPRQMLNATSDVLQFQLYADPARTQIWGSSGTPAAPTPVGSDFDYQSPTPGTQVKSFTIYGRVPVQTLVAGAYANSFSGIHTTLDYRFAEAPLATAAYPTSCTAGGTGGASTTNAFPFNASATVPSSCRAYSASNLDFGAIPGLVVANANSISTIGLTCTGRTAWAMGLNNGLNPNGSTRRMKRGVADDFVTYELYRDSAWTSRWGNTVNTDTVDSVGTGLQQLITVYGRLPAPQTPVPGSYSDTVTVTVTY